MYKILRKVLITNKKSFYFLIMLLIFSLSVSAVIFYIFQKGTLVHINYNAIEKLSFHNLLLSILIRNLFYFLLIFIITLFNNYKLIYSIFSISSIFWGLSIIYTIKIFKIEKLYFIFTCIDYFFYFPLLFYFSFISVAISKYIKKNKLLGTKLNNYDIIIISYIKITLIIILIIILYSLLYSGYISILLEMLVK